MLARPVVSTIALAMYFEGVASNSFSVKWYSTVWYGTVQLGMFHTSFSITDSLPSMLAGSGEYHSSVCEAVASQRGDTQLKCVYLLHYTE